MLIIAIILLMAAVVVIIWRFAFAADSTSSHIKTHSKRIDGLKQVTSKTRHNLVETKIKHTGAVDAVPDDDLAYGDDDDLNSDYYSGPGTYVQKAVSASDRSPEGYYNSLGLPPMITVATGLAAVIVVVALVAALILLLSPSANKIQSSKTSVATSIATHGQRKQTATTTTSLASIQPVSVSSNSVVYNAPQGKYKFVITVTTSCWVEITQDPNTANSSNVVAQTVTAGNTITQTVSGPSNLDLGNSGVTVTINGIPLAFPPGHLYGSYEFR
jgi:hypothetical protein